LSDLTGISERLLKPFPKPPRKHFGKPGINPASLFPALYINMAKLAISASPNTKAPKRVKKSFGGLILPPSGKCSHNALQKVMVMFLG
jgi:hypothetical protein